MQTKMCRPNLDGSTFHAFDPATVKDLPAKRWDVLGTMKSSYIGCRAKTTVSTTLAESQHVGWCSTVVDVKHQHT